MSDISNTELDRVLHQPVRTRVAAFLATHGEATFTDLKHALKVTDGNLEAHMKKLVAADYVMARKESGNGRPQTFYLLSKLGEKNFRFYVDALQALLAPEK